MKSTSSGAERNNSAYPLLAPLNTARSKASKAIPAKPASDVARMAVLRIDLDGAGILGRFRNQMPNHLAPAQCASTNNVRPAATRTSTGFEGCNGKSTGPIATLVNVAHQTATMRIAGEERPRVSLAIGCIVFGIRLLARVV